MNESEKRRKKLLEETRSLYSDWRTPPAVHPRYRAAYRRLYPGKRQKRECRVHSGCGPSAVSFCSPPSWPWTTRGGTILEADSQRITEEIATDLDVAEVWKNL